MGTRLDLSLSAPDGLLCIPVGAPCNIYEPDPDRYALLKRMKADGSGVEVFARAFAIRWF